MKKKSQTAIPSKKKSPILTIGLSMLGVIAIIFVAAQLFSNNGERKREIADSEVNVSAPTEDIFREDGTLAFINNDGTVNTSIKIEIAETEQTRTKGLMGRNVMRPDQGMLFIFEDETPRSFWMANTPLPLDILFVDQQYRIVKIHTHTKPYSEESLRSEKSAKYVVEVNAGFCDQFGIREGTGINWVRN